MSISNLLIVLATLFVMEWAVAFIHKYVMHGFGWEWHRSHHERRKDAGWEKNDLYAIVFSLATILLFAVGSRHEPIWWIALGITLYGLLYALLHDVLTHRRLPIRWQVKSRYLRRLVAAHRMHHAVSKKEGAVSYGFLYAPPIDVVRRQLRDSLDKE